MTNAAQQTQATFNLFAGSKEIEVVVQGVVEPATEQHFENGLPTEAQDDTEVYYTSLTIKGQLIEVDSQYKFWLEKFGLTMTELEEIIEEKLIESLDIIEDDFDYSDDAIF